MRQVFYPQIYFFHFLCYSIFMTEVKKPLKEKFVPPTIEEVENSSLDLESNSLEEECEKKLTPQQVKVIKKIAYYLSKVGFTLEEACTVNDVEIETLNELMERYGFIRKIIRIKELQFKEALLKTISGKARLNDDKLALWLLERRWPGEFGSRKTSQSGNGDEDILAEAIDFIQESGSNTPLVEKESGIPIRDKKGSSLVKKITDILS